ncbi:hypothetical protein HM1_0456 [Heliomicrobium modesticaldum Ice1]|uniref:Uncharacterized protein n=1 Tax=Heliobacterium modesticaldum (strain ATCC 51547 / Ice1) TaxID=498761 RepID=B0TFH4_HELMI|nr:hypothetical protein HM1_0456 [Heliomicrobium modesticaldum Ice1]
MGKGLPYPFRPSLCLALFINDDRNRFSFLIIINAHSGKNSTAPQKKSLPEGCA